MRPARLLLLAACVLALAGCGPAFEGWAAVTVVRGEVVLITRPCDTTVAETRLEGGTGPRQIPTVLVEDDTEVSSHDFGHVPTGVRVSDLRPGTRYTVEVTTDDWTEQMFGVSFRVGDLVGLEPGQVVVDGQLGDGVVGGAAVLDKEDYVRRACED